MKNKRFRWLTNGKTVEERIRKYKIGNALIKNSYDEKLVDVLTKTLASDEEVLSTSNEEIDDIVKFLLAKSVVFGDLKNSLIFIEYLEKSENEECRKFARETKLKLAHIESMEFMNKEKASNQESDIQEDKKEDGEDNQSSKNDEEIEYKSIERDNIWDMVNNGKFVNAKAYVYRMKGNPNKQKIFAVELARAKNTQSLEKIQELKSTNDEKREKVADQIEKEVSERENKAIEITRELATQKEPLEDDILPLVMRNAMFDPDGTDLAKSFALRYLKDPTCFRSIEKEAICLMLVNLYKQEGNYEEIINILTSLMKNLDDSNRTKNLNTYERELLYDLGEAYLYQSNGKISEENMSKLISFVENFADPNNPNHSKFLSTLIEDLKNKEELLKVSVIEMPLIPETTYKGVEREKANTAKIKNDKYSDELSIEKRIEYIAQKELSNGLIPKAFINLDDKNFTGYIAILGMDLERGKQEPFYHVEKLFDIKKVQPEKRAECLEKLRRLLNNNPNIDLYTFKDIVTSEIGIPEAYGAASYLIKVEDLDVGIGSQLGTLVDNSHTIEKFENAIKRLKTLPKEEKESEAKQYKVLKYNHNTGKNLSNPTWYAKTNRAYDAFREMECLAQGEEYTKSEQEINFENNSRNKRVSAYISRPDLSMTHRVLYERIDKLEDIRLNIAKVKQAILDMQKELEMNPDVEAHEVAEADFILDEIARIYNKKYKSNIYLDAGIATEDDIKKEEELKEQIRQSKKGKAEKPEILNSANQIMEEPKVQLIQDEVSKYIAEHDSKYKQHKKEIKEKSKTEPVVDEDQTEKEKMIELLKEYREFSYKACEEYREKLARYKALEKQLEKNRNIYKSIKKEIDGIESGAASVDPITGEIIWKNTNDAPDGNGDIDKRTGTDDGR